MLLMALTKEWLAEAREKYRKVRKLIDEDSKNDSISEPYKSKYEARNILQKLESDLNIKRDEKLSNILSSLINFDLGVLAVDTEEPSAGEDYLKKCLEIIGDSRTDPKCCILYMNALNQLGILWSERNELKQACEYLKEAENIYQQYHRENATVYPIDPFELFTNDVPGQQGCIVLEKVYTHTLYYLAQVYQNLDENETAVMYCHKTLKRQLESGDYQPIEWALNCATLSQYFFASDNFSASRYFLACADYVLTNYEISSQKNQSDEEQWNKIRHCKASIARCWIKYGLLILSVSEQDLFAKASKNDESNSKEQNEKNLPESTNAEQKYLLLTVPEISEIEKKITNQCILNFQQARAVFLCVQNWVKIAKEYFTLDGYTTDHVQLTQDLSRLYKLLAFFEPCADRQCKMHKRRIDILEDVLQQLNPQFYLLICRQLMFELAETYSEMMDIKLSIMEENHTTSSTIHAIKKINALIYKSIQYFEKFIDTLKDSTRKLPENFSDDIVRPALVAHFCVGRLYSKLTVEPQQQLEYLNKTEKYYQYIIDYIKNNPSQKDSVKEELPLVKEMVLLIPGKMQSIISGTLY